MACRITELVLDCADPGALSRWWCAVPTLVLDRSADPRRGKLPLHVDVRPTDREQDAELERLLELGARRADVGQRGEETWHVLADPEGNELCLLRRRVEPV